MEIGQYKTGLVCKSNLSARKTKNRDAIWLRWLFMWITLKIMDLKDSAFYVAAAAATTKQSFVFSKIMSHKKLFTKSSFHFAVMVFYPVVAEPSLIKSQFLSHNSSVKYQIKKFSPPPFMCQFYVETE